ncbi:hypothetical protein GOODEAATRI_015911, partial [Goodea atripinnis]
LLKCGKGTTYEGGMREPAIASWPGVIKPGVTHEMASTLDILPTIANWGSTRPTSTLEVAPKTHRAHDPPLIFDLEADPSERYPLPLEGRPDIQAVLAQIETVKAQFEATMVFGESQISKGVNPDLEPCCTPTCSPKPTCCHC